MRQFPTSLNTTKRFLLHIAGRMNVFLTLLYGLGYCFMSDRKKYLSESHAIRGQNRYGELVQYFKAYPPADTERALEAIAIAAGQFARNNREHFELCKAAANACLHGNMAGWWEAEIQNVLHRRALAQLRTKKLPVGLQQTIKNDAGWDVRVKWAGWRYQANLFIQDHEAIELGLTDIVNTGLSRYVKRLRKTPEQWRKQTQAASDARTKVADDNSVIAVDLLSKGHSLQSISTLVRRSLRTVYSYLRRGMKLLFSGDRKFRFEERNTNHLQPYLFSFFTKPLTSRFVENCKNPVDKHNPIKPKPILET